MVICKTAKTEGLCMQIKVCTGSGDVSWNILLI